MFEKVGYPNRYFAINDDRLWHAICMVELYEYGKVAQNVDLKEFYNLAVEIFDWTVLMYKDDHPYNWTFVVIFLYIELILVIDEFP